jgi:hypothetical protein
MIANYSGLVGTRLPATTARDFERTGVLAP